MIKNFPSFSLANPVFFSNGFNVNFPPIFSNFPADANGNPIGAKRKLDSLSASIMSLRVETSLASRPSLRLKLK